MKTTFTIIATLFIIQSNLLFADGGNAQALFTDHMLVTVREVHSFTDGIPPENLFFVRDLIPSVPVEATFGDEITADELKSLSPENPGDADFNDSDLVPESSPAIHSLAPVTPAAADFNDSDGSLIQIVPDLAPLTPKEADFTDTEISVSNETLNLAPVVPEKAEFEEHV